MLTEWRRTLPDLIFDLPGDAARSGQDRIHIMHRGKDRVSGVALWRDGNAEIQVLPVTAASSGRE